MSKPGKTIQAAEAPVKRAMVFICEKCGKRIGGSGHKNASYHLASRFKRDLKRTFDKGDVRIVLTSCMDVCPEDSVAICVQPTAPGSAALFLLADIDDIEASSEELAKIVRRSSSGN